MKEWEGESIAQSRQHSGDDISRNDESFTSSEGQQLPIQMISLDGLFSTDPVCLRSRTSPISSRLQVFFMRSLIPVPRGLLSVYPKASFFN